MSKEEIMPLVIPESTTADSLYTAVIVDLRNHKWFRCDAGAH
jgi:hypothetical protein